MRLGFKHLKSLLELDRRQEIYKFLAYAAVILLAVGWFYNCAGLHFNTYNNFSVYGTDDVSDYNQAVWNTAKGRLFQYNNRYTEETVLAHINITTLSLHSNFIFLLIALFYLILPHFSVFILLQSLFMAMSIVALYLVAREMLTEKRILPLLIVLVYTQYFPLTSVAHFFHPEEFSLFFIFLAFYFYLKNNLKLTLAFAIASIFCREEASFIFLILGLVSCFRPDKKKYFLPLTLLGALSFLFIKLFSNTTALLEIHYGYLGTTFLEKIKNIIFRPALVINNILRSDRVTIFRDIFEPLLYLPFLAPMLFMPGAVILVEVLLSRSWPMGALRWQPWYLCSLIPFVFIALAGAFEKIYRLAKPLGKILPLILIGFLFLYTYISNFRLTQSNNNAFRDYFSIDRYWRNDTFEVLSGINKEARVVCSLKLMPMLSSRRHILPLGKLSKRIINQGFYDIIILSEGDYTPGIDSYLALMKDTKLYEKAYSTPYMSVFTKKDAALPLGDWRFNLISEIRKSAVTHNYIISNFTDYASILENANALEYLMLIKELYQNRKLHYAALEAVPLGSDTNTQSFVSYRPLEKGSGYILAFAAKTDKNTDVIYVKKPADKDKEWDEIKIDNKLRLFMLPFEVTQAKPSCVVKMQIGRGCSVLTPIVLRCPFDYTQDIGPEPIFEASADQYKFSYNPWLRSENFPKESAGHYQFLRRHMEKNPLLYFMRSIGLTLPADLYKYSWVESYTEPSEVMAIRY